MTDLGCGAVEAIALGEYLEVMNGAGEEYLGLEMVRNIWYSFLMNMLSLCI